MNFWTRPRTKRGGNHDKDDGMRKTAMVVMAWAGMAIAPVQAQVPATSPAAVAPSARAAAVPADGIRTESTVVVTGEQPGPGLWLVRHGGNDLWILGTINPLPANMQWQSGQVDAVIANAQEVLHAPSVSVDADIGKFRALFLLPSLLGVRKNPQGKSLREVVPAGLYARWVPFRERFLGNDDDVEAMRPVFAAEALWKAVIKRSGLTDKDQVKPVVAAAIERHHPNVTVVKQTIKVKDPKALIRQFKAAQLEDVACLERTLDRLGGDMEAMRARANAWATGDLAALRATPLSDQYQVCMDAVTESGIGRSLGMGDVSERLRAEWMAKAESALARNKTTFAVLSMREMLRPGGYIERLKAKGYTVLAPDE